MTDENRRRLSELWESIRAKQELLAEVESELNGLRLKVNEYFQKIYAILEEES